jgi:hypothetical protein
MGSTTAGQQVPGATCLHLPVPWPTLGVTSTTTLLQAPAMWLGTIDWPGSIDSARGQGWAGRAGAIKPEKGWKAWVKVSICSRR